MEQSHPSSQCLNHSFLISILWEVAGDGLGVWVPSIRLEARTEAARRFQSTTSLNEAFGQQMGKDHLSLSALKTKSK